MRRRTARRDRGSGSKTPARWMIAPQRRRLFEWYVAMRPAPRKPMRSCSPIGWTVPDHRPIAGDVSNGGCSDSIDETTRRNVDVFEDRGWHGRNGSFADRGRSCCAVGGGFRLSCMSWLPPHRSQRVDPRARHSSGDARQLSDASARTAAEIGHDVSKRHGVRVVEHPRIGEPASVLMAVAEMIDADLIVVGSTGHRVRQSRRSAGSVREPTRPTNRDRPY